MIAGLLRELKDNNIAVSLDKGELKVKFNDAAAAKDLIDKVKEKKSQLIEYLSGLEKYSVETAIEVQQQDDSYPLSSSQRRLWVLSQFEEGNIAYNMPGAYFLEGDVNIKAFEYAFSLAIERHESLRTLFREEKELVQVISTPAESGFVINHHDLSRETITDEKIKNIVQEESLKPFDLETGPLLRADFWKLAGNRWLFTYTMHHIVSDGWSMEILMRELTGAYNACINREPVPFAPLRIQYRDYAVWQQEQLLTESFVVHKNYWLKQFEGEIPVLELPTDFPRPAYKTYKGEKIYKTIDTTLTKKIRSLGQEQGATLFMTLLASVNCLLYRYTGQDDIITGSPVAGRGHHDLEDQIGLYVNTLALRVRFSGTNSFLELLANVKQVTLDALEHQDYPFDELLDQLQLKRDMSRSALFDVMVALQNTKIKNKTEQSGLTGIKRDEYRANDVTTSKFDIIFDFEEKGGELDLRIEYNRDIFQKHAINRMGDHLLALMNECASTPDVAINATDFLSVAEKDQLLNGFNNTANSYPSHSTIAMLFEKQVNETPGNTAIIFNGSAITYKELNESANQLAGYLVHYYGRQTGNTIGILMDRSGRAIIAMLGTMKAGGAYLPVDPEYPQERIAYMKEDSNCKIMIDEIEFNRFVAEKEQFSRLDPPAPGQASDLAYIMYTSGTMGKPKGVMVEQRSVVRLVKSADYINLSEKDTVLSLSNFSFDGSVFDIFGALLNGAALVIPPKMAIADSHAISELIDKYDVSVFFVTTALFNAFTDTNLLNFNKLQSVLFGGEHISGTHVKKFREKLPHVKLIHVYGPTENTTFSLSYAIAGDTTLIPIGKPISNSTAYIMNERQKLAPTGITGEICVGGAGLSRGYLNQRELTDEKFIRNPYKSDELIYRTGDVGKWLADGNIEFIGRLDDQVKIRGYRIEPGEIGSTLREFPGINDAIVTVRNGSNGEKQLVAYVTGGEEINMGQLKIFLSRSLPHYMIPAFIMQLDSLPLNSNGKIDKKSLPDPEGSGMQTETEYVAPRNEIEERLVTIWQELLGKENIGVTDNLFELGGHSLKATRLASQLHRDFNVKVGMQDLFANAVLADQAALIQQTQKSFFSSIAAAPVQSSYPLSSSQRRLWVLCQLAEANIAYNMPGAYILEGNLDISAFEYAFETLIERHESLRTVFRENEQGDLRQFIQLPGEICFSVNYHDLRGKEQVEELIKKRVNVDYTRPFDIGKGPLLYAALYRAEDNRWVFTCTMHHIVSDGWSMEILIRELLLFYNARINGENNPLEPLRIQYKDYAVWQNDQVIKEDFSEQRTYWLKQFQGNLPVLELPGDKPRPAFKTYSGGTIYKSLGKEQVQKIKSISQEQGSTLFMGLLAAVNVLLFRYTDQEDIIVGTPVAGRDHLDLEDQIGFYLNTLALRSRFCREDSYRQLLDNAREVTIDAYKHQAYPFDELVEILNIKPDLSRSALFDVIVTLRRGGDTNPGEQRLGDIKVSGYEGGYETISKFDLTFEFEEKADDLDIRIVYNDDIFHNSSVNRMGDHLVQIITAISKQPGIPIGKIDYLTAAEKHRLVKELNDTETEYPLDGTIVQLFEDQVKKTPSGTAVSFGEISLTYKQLNELANQLAGYLLLHYHIGPDDLVGILLDRSEKMIVVMLAILKAGGAYVPIDPEYPQERIDYMTQDSQCKIVIDLHWYNKFEQERSRYNESDRPLMARATDLAYIIYTSGTTGKPKGVMIQHNNVVRLFKTGKPMFHFGSHDVWTMFHSYCFDFSVWEMYGALFFGGRLVIVPRITSQDAMAFLELLQNEQVTVLNQTPSAFYQLLKQDGVGQLALRYIIFGGEALSPGKLDEWSSIYPGTKLINMYGITETTVHVTYKEITGREIEENISNIGSSLPTVSCYVLDQNLSLCPVGVPGELHVGGAGVGRGYLNLPVLTSERFIDNIFEAGGRLYRSGDKVRMLENGELEYLGRIDDQVKIRGYRIELGEVSNALARYHLVTEAIVLARSNAVSEMELVAYIVSKEKLNSADLRFWLSTILPQYMVPAHFVQLEALPLTPNGKVDKKLLPDPVEWGMQTGVSYIAPSNETEEKLVAIWQDILNIEMIGVKDNFFDLGGHSLKATRLASQLHKYFEVKVGLRDLFANPVLEEQAALISQTKKTSFISIKPAVTQSSYPLSSSQRRLWVMSQFAEGNAAYNMPGAYFLEGSVDLAAFKNAFSTLIQRHESLRTIFRVDENGEIRQVILLPEQTGFSVNFHDMREETARDATIQQYVQNEFVKPFNLQKGPLLRAAIYQVEDARWVLTCTMHHIISDGWSMEILVRELELFYNAAIRNELNPLEPLRIHYKDYAVWQQEQLLKKEFLEHRSYWLKQFEGEVPVLELLADRVRPAVKTYRGAFIHRTINKEIADKLRSLSQQKDCTLYMALLTVVNVLLFKYTGQEDIVVGSLVAGREHIDIEDQIGFYVNTLALRLRFSSDDNYLQMLENAKQITMDAFNHQLYPFDELVDALNLKRDISRSPLFDVMVVLQNNENDQFRKQHQLTGMKVSEFTDGSYVHSMFELLFNFTENDGEIYADIGYNTDIYNKNTIERVGDHLLQLLTAIVTGPGQAIGEIDYISDVERYQLLTEFNATGVEYPHDATIIQLFEAQVKKTPHNTAIVFEGKTLTYEALNNAANRFAGYLKHYYQVQAEDLAAVLLDRSEKFIIAVLGILKAGAAYTPIDPEYPQQRIDFIKEDSNCKILIDADEFERFNSEKILYNETGTGMPGQPAGLAYVVYTSGTTGMPKGVMVENQSLVNLCYWHIKRFSVTEKDKATLYAGVAFDASVWELFPYIISGAAICIVPAELRFDIGRLNTFYEQNLITISFLPTQMGEYFLKINNSSLRYLLLGGDKLNIISDQLYTVINNYGPAETTVVATSGVVNKTGNISIGKPIDNTSIYILNNAQQPVPLGIPGEIYIGGKNLARGYINQPGLTAEKFIADPFKIGGRMYRSGDTGRWLADGTIEFLGRCDEQVKIRGNRVETGEVEYALQRYTGILSAVVTVKNCKDGDKELVAYICGEKEISIPGLRMHLANMLPVYMLPRYYVQLDVLPLTANGKIDRLSLPEPVDNLQSEVYVAPGNNVEEKLVAIWKEILGKDKIGIMDNFFELGGHSLKATRLISYIHKEFDVHITLQDLFISATIEDQARAINKIKWFSADVELNNEIMI